MKPFTMLTIAFLMLLAVLQFIRFMFAWPVEIDGTMVPVWVSGVAAILAAGLGTMLWQESYGWNLPPAGWFRPKLNP